MYMPHRVDGGRCQIRRVQYRQRDKVAQLVRCRIGNQRVAGSNPGRLGHFGLFLGNIVYPILLQSTQLYNGYLA